MICAGATGAIVHPERDSFAAGVGANPGFQYLYRILSQRQCGRMESRWGTGIRDTETSRAAPRPPGTRAFRSAMDFLALVDSGQEVHQHGKQQLRVVNVWFVSAVECRYFGGGHDFLEVGGPVRFKKHVL
jgi:hypothetical protein